MSVSYTHLDVYKRQLLDEATASLDEETEQNIIHSLKAHGKDKMIIVVSHRKQVIDVCDKKYVLNFL